MTYDMQLGMLATEAITDLVAAEGSHDEALYRSFLENSAEYCRRIRAADVADLACSSGQPKAVSAFISAVMNVSESKSSESDKDRFRLIQQIEPVIESILQQRRRPNSEEQMKIAEVLYSTSGADFR